MLKGEARIKEINDIWDRIKNKCKENNLILLTKIKEYKNSHTKLYFICVKHKDKGTLKRSVNKFLISEKGCKYCGYNLAHIKHKKSFDFIKKEFNKRNYILLDNIYINSHVSMRYICKFHPNIIQSIEYANLSQGQGCKYCGNEKISQSKRTSIQEWKIKFSEKELTLISETYINEKSELKFICNKHPDFGIQTTNYDNFYSAQHVCKVCAKENRSGINHHNYKGNITSLHKYLRDQIKQWKFDSFNYYNKTCVITGIKNKNNIIHHLYSFNLIVDEVIKELNYPIHNDYNLYSYLELNNITELFIKKHYEYGLGVCLTKEIHNLFHKLYGKGNNTPEQFYEFKQKIESGEIQINKVA